MSLLSIIIPAYNEGALIQNTASVVADIMEKHSIDYEIVFVNDGSKDATWDEIQKAHRNNEKVWSMFLKELWKRRRSICRFGICERRLLCRYGL